MHLFERQAVFVAMPFGKNEPQAEAHTSPTHRGTHTTHPSFLQRSTTSGQCELCPFATFQDQVGLPSPAAASTQRLPVPRLMRAPCCQVPAHHLPRPCPYHASRLHSQLTLLMLLALAADLRHLLHLMRPGQGGGTAPPKT